MDSIFLLSHQRCKGQSYRNWYLFSDLLFPKVRENRLLKSWWKGRKQVPKLVVFFKNDTVASVNISFLLNTKTDCQPVSPSPRADGSLLQTDSFSDSHHHHGEACRALQKWASIISGTASCQSCHLHVRVQKGEKHRSLKQGSELYCHKIHIVFLSPFKIIKIAYLFLPVWTSSQLFGLLYSFPRYSEDTRLSFQYSLSDPAFQIHCTYASTHSAQGP